MGSDKKYSSLEHSAPEVVELQDAPEVVSSAGRPLHRQSSLLQPEAYEVRPHWKQEPDGYGAYGTHSSDGDSQLPIYPGAGATDRKGYTNVETGKPNHSGDRRDERRCCGLSKKVFILVIVAIVLLIAIAAILGGVLGTVLPSSGSDGKPLESISKTGLATVKTEDGKLYQYFQIADGSIVENSYSSGEWSLSAGSEDSDDALVTTGAGASSPFAAVSYSYKGDQYRQVFYITSTGELHTINRTDSRSWGSSTMITPDAASSGSIGLTACASEVGLEGIRVYYASQANWIQEMAGYFNGSNWEKKHSFSGADAKSGAACSVHINDKAQYLILYVRDPQSSLLNQWWRDFATDDPHYYAGAKGWKNYTVAKGSDIAVTSDGQDTEYVFYQLDGGVITRGVTNPYKELYQTFSNTQGATIGSKLAAAYVEDGAMIMFQNSSSESTMWAVDVSRFGFPIFDTAVS